MNSCRGERRGARKLAALGAAAAMWLAAGQAAVAQHATAFDVEDGGRAYEASCANCHGPDGDLIANIDFGRGVYRSPLTDEQIVRIILNGIPSTPMPPTPGISEEQAFEIAAYLRSMPDARALTAASGDPVRGRALFDGRGGCKDCHRVNGEGSRLGPNLSRSGQLRRAVELERSLLEPQAEVQPENRFYSVTTQSGATITGRLLNHDTYTVQMLDEDERLRSFHKDDLADHGFAESPMPSFRDELGAQDIADIVSYLSTLTGGPTR